MARHFLVAAALLFTLSGNVGAGPATNPSPVGQAPTTIVDAIDPSLRFVGRWDRSQPGVACGYWNGHYLRTRFTGTSVSVRLVRSTGLAVSIDGEPLRSVSGGAGVTLLNPKPLRAGEHTLQLGSDGQNYEVAFQGLVLDAGAQTRPSTPRPVIEFVGDSITTGTSSNYAWCTAEMLGRDHVQIAFSGVALTDGFGCTSQIGMETQYFRLKNYNHAREDSQQDWDFSQYTPEMVVILLCQNDQCGQAPADKVSAAYVRFVRKIRAKYPQAPIVMMRTLGGPYEAAIRQAFEQLNQNDAKVHYVDTTGWLGRDDFADGVHPSAGGHLKVARLLSNQLAPMLTAPITVLTTKAVK